jgi:beta-glucanase (GH16 family)
MNEYGKPMAGLLLLMAVLTAAGACGSGGETPSSPEPPQEEPPDSGVWTLVWQDEFDGTSLDENRWSVQEGDGCDLGICGWGNNELQWYQEDNLNVANGFLTITARRESVGGKPYSSARIRSYRKGDWTYARVEFRARLPEGQGLWPAIWMLPTDDYYGGWAASGEIDIVELLGHEPNRVLGTLHYGGQWPANQQSGSSFTLNEGTFSEDFHTFALEWENGVIRWSVDGTLYQTQTHWSTSGGSFPAPFDKRFHLLLNVAVGGDLPGNPDSTTSFPQQMVVDWIRVYQRK